jgi:two-component system cell cycle response regulator
MAAHILIIDDHPANLELMRYLLEAFHYRVSVASSGEEGVDLAWHKHPDLILCDIQMQGIDGYEVMRRLRSHRDLAGIPVVAVTALAMVGDRDKILRAGFDGYLSKPIDPETFVAQAEAFLPPGARNTPPARAPTTALQPMTLPAAGRTLLAVDNLQVNLDLATTIFAAFGYRVVTTSDIKQALSLAQQSPPDVILSDVCMPQGTGYDFIRLVKADHRLQRIPFVFITSTVTNEQDRQKGLALGAAKFLFRPIEPWVFLNEIEDFFRKEKVA